MDTECKDGEFVSSKLGTKEYWDNCYDTENVNFDDHGDVGEVWFGEEAAARMVTWLEDREQEGEIDLDSAILDVGCGNGVLTIDIFKAGFTNLTGVDYSTGAIELAKKIAQKDECDIRFDAIDLLDRDIVKEKFLESFRIVVDKGTFDAISLSESASKDKVTYVEHVSDMLVTDGLLLITSCNWTQSELVTLFSKHFTLKETVPTPTFTFGGKTGASTTFCIFKKIS